MDVRVITNGSKVRTINLVEIDIEDFIYFCGYDLNSRKIGVEGVFSGYVPCSNGRLCYVRQWGKLVIYYVNEEIEEI